MKGMFKKQMFVQSKNMGSDTPGCSSSSNSIGSTFIDPAKYMVNGEFVFTVPPEAPVFFPTTEEFTDPLEYIRKIRPIAEQTGICKIKPPPEWHPPFAVDVDNFKFTPRIQKLNELDANTRVRLYFLDRLATYWNYSGLQIRIPAIDGKTVDMYSLYKIVEMEGGYEVVNADKKWTIVARRMGYVNEKVVSQTLRHHYRRLLIPYEKFERMKLLKKETNDSKEDVKNVSLDLNGIKSENEKTPIKRESEESSNGDLTPGDTPDSKSSPDVKGRRVTRSTCDDIESEILVSKTFKDPQIQDKNKELQRLTFYGPGPKIWGPDNGKKKKKPVEDAEETDLLADYACRVCSNGDDEACILLCDDCDHGYHTYCLVPPLNAVPKGDWRCPKCVAAAVGKTNDAFGFEQAEREYTLQQFGEMADQFKCTYFKMPVHLVPTSKVEQEYWKILSCMDSNVTVEYGADLHSMDHGSGFPTKSGLASVGRTEQDHFKPYVDSNWNLNNLPVVEGSVLRHINADISGMKIPWMYVGMCFSTFCWHNEDHWSYSINYLHWGEPKTWYGVPGSSAEHFERVMQQTTPDLFQNQPDLLHQLVTILNPNILMDRKVPVYHIDQAAGEFVLTFPRAYHAGFNHGYNFAEAVNFCPIDWVPLGRECVDHYSSLHRYCVFSHDELICKMAALYEELNSKHVLATHEDMIKMLEFENKQRKMLLEWGVINAERQAFEVLADDERQCCQCNTTCFLSAVTCNCNPKKVVCLRHFHDLCKCTPMEHTLKYRYTLDELPIMVENLKNKIEAAEAWEKRVKDSIDGNNKRTTFESLKTLLNEGKQLGITPTDKLMGSLEDTIASVNTALAVDFNDILSPTLSLEKKVTIIEIKSYYEELLRIPVILPQESLVKQFLSRVKEFLEKGTIMLNNDSITKHQVDDLFNHVNFPNVVVPEVDTMKQKLSIALWIAQYKTKCKERISVATLNEMITSAQNIKTDDSKIITRAMVRLTALKQHVTDWEEKCKLYFTSNNNELIKPHYNDLQKLIEQSQAINIILPNRERLLALNQKVLKWKGHINRVLNYKHKPFVQLIRELIVQGKNQNMELPEISVLEEMIQEASVWRGKAKELFFGNNKNLSLVSALLPRQSFKGVNNEGENSTNILFNSSTGLKLIDDIEPGDISKMIKILEEKETQFMISTRMKNVDQRERLTSRHCICNMPLQRSMKECVLCKKLYHESCIINVSNFLSSIYDPGSQILCCYCQRTNRPLLTDLEDIVKPLDIIKTRLIEGVALIRLLERAREWQDHASKFLMLKEVTEIVQKMENDELLLENGNHQIKINKETNQIIELLAIRGYLMEVRLPQMELICKLLKYGKMENNDNELENEVILVESPMMKEKKRKSSSDKIEPIENNKVIKYNNIINNKNTTPIKITPPVKNTTPAKMTTPLKITPPVKNTTPIKSNNVKKTGSKRKYASKKARSESLEEEHEDEECDMKENCIKPKLEQVDWVQCDYCKGWLHMICINVTKSQVDAKKEFKCPPCIQYDKTGSDSVIIID